MIEWLKDRWLTWRTGKDKELREWEAWCKTNVVYGASSIRNRFMHFKHIIVVDPEKFLDYSDPFGFFPHDNASEYFYPERQLGENAVWCFERVRWDKWQEEWMIEDFAGERDMVFVATNSDEDAIMIALKWS